MARNSSYQKQRQQEFKRKLDALKSDFPEYIRDYFDEKELSVQLSTSLAYAYDLHMFLEFLIQENPLCHQSKPKEIPLEVIAGLDFRDVNEYQKWLSYAGPYSNKERGVERRILALRNLFDFLTTHEYIEKNPVRNAAKCRKPPKDDIIRMDAKETNAMMDAVISSSAASERQKKFREKAKQRDTAITTLLLNTGIRVSECVGLDLDDLDLKSGTMTVLRKGGKTQTLYLNQETIQTLQDYIDGERRSLVGDGSGEKAVFLSNRKMRMCARSIELMVKKYARESVPGKHITPHKLRSTYGTALYQATGDIRLVADVLGHENINTTAKYYAAIEEGHRKTAAQIELYRKE